MKNELSPEPAKRSATWIVTAKWAHPAWDQYLFMLVDLDSIDNPPAMRHRKGDTHELLVFALNPVKPNASILKPKLDGLIGLEVQWLDPANYGYQFKAETHDQAVNRVQTLVDAVHRRKLNPDTDWRTLWNVIFWDAYPLVTSAFANAVDNG